MFKFNSIIEIPFKTAVDFPERISHKIRIGKSFIDKTYRELAQDIKACGVALEKAGITVGDHVSFFVCNRYEWIVCDFALMLLSAVSVPRGSDTTVNEQQFLFHHSDSNNLIIENVEQLKKLITVFKDEDFTNCRKIVIIEDGDLIDIDEEIAAKV
ncbi:MAG: AMP-binding protein, partial [Deltaproteobacteria bacterium]|nr:AMP-binding protein [Deltaproteobacteria bacterium]